MPDKPLALRRFVAAIALIGCAQLASAAPLSIDYFTREGDFGTAKISPDGAYLAVSADVGAESHIAFYTLKPFKAVSGLSAGEGLEIRYFAWASPTRIIYTLAQRMPGLEEPGMTGEIFAINRDGTGHKIVYGYRVENQRRATDTHLPQAKASYGWADLLSDLKDDDRDILACEHPAERIVTGWRYDPDARPLLVRIDIQNANKKVIEALPLADACPLLDKDDVARFAVGFDRDGKLDVMWKPEQEWESFELPGFRRDTVFPQYFMPDNHSVLLTATPTEGPVSALYRLDLATHAVEKLYAHESADVGSVVTDLADEVPVGVEVEADKPEIHWLEPDSPTAKLYQMLERAFPGQAVTFTSATKDQSQAIALVYSDVNPGDYYLIDVASRHASFIAPRRSWVDPAKMRHKETISLAARDGPTLHGYLTRPRDEPGPYPLVVLPHGGPHYVRDTWDFDWEAQLLASYGYAVLQVNYRGSDGYGEDFMRAGFREWGGKIQDDITDATLWAIQQNIAAKDNICIYGSSFGGYAALMGAVREPSLYQCAASYAGVTDLELMYKRGDTHESAIGRYYLRDVLGQDPQDLHARSPAYNADKIQIPILLIHGKADWRVDYEHATRMRDALEAAHKDVQFVSLNFEGHGAYDQENRIAVYTALLDFLAKHLRGGSALMASSAQAGQP
jgi:dipeptidyl aminopeptidase/acylaminoacyl peptidase